MGYVYALADAARENWRMNIGLYDWMWNTGIIQFGYFVNNDEIAPFRFCPEYLPAYPQLLAEVAKLALCQLDILEIDHLIATADSVPLGVACSLQSGLSLAYSRGKGDVTIYDLVGSYNSGHMSTLIVNCLEDPMIIQKFVANARSVGLETLSIVTLLEMRPFDQLANIPVRSVFRLVDIALELVTAGRLSEGQSQAVLKWINVSDNNDVNRRPDSGLP